MRFDVLPSAAFLKHPRTPPGGPGMDYQTADSEHLMKRLRTGQPDEVWKLGNSINLLNYIFFHDLLTRV